jgi:acyl-ACP thioesterase
MVDEARVSATVDYRVRFDECTPAGTLRASSYLRYAQDVAWIHSERLGYDRAWYLARSLAWLVRGVELAILTPSHSGESLSVTTRVTGFRRVWARRRTDVHDTAGRIVAWAHTDWVMTDARGLPTRVPAEFAAGFSTPPDSFTPTRVALPEPPAGALAHRFAVRPQELDPMGHVNNAVYVDWVDEAAEPLWGEGLVTAPRRYRLEYLLPVPPSAVLDATAWRDGTAMSCLLRQVAGPECLRARLQPERRPA